MYKQRLLCPTCTVYKQLDINGKCKKCNKIAGLKECGRCGIIQLLALEFYDQKRACKTCISKYKRANKQAIKEQQRKYRDTHKEQLKDTQLQINYGISLDDYKQMSKNQNDKCKLCLTKSPLHVDHCHKTGRVRGLLCNNCNRGIGLLRDNPEVLSRAVKYLTQ